MRWLLRSLAGTKRRALVSQIASVVVLAAFSDATCLAQAPKDGKHWKLNVNGLIARQFRTCRPEIVSGRLAIFGSGESRRSESSSSRNGFKEKLLLAETDGIVTLQYEQTSQQGRFAFDLAEGGALSIRCEPVDSTLHDAWSLSHPPHGTAASDTRPEGAPLEWLLSTGGTQRRLEAESLWELLASEPEWARATLIPLMAKLFPDWKLEESLEQVQSELVKLAERQPDVVPTQWSQWVEELGAEKFSTRETAARQLAAAGRAAVPFLKSLKTQELDAEQRFRIRTILEALVGDEFDSAPMVAESLAVKTNPWLGLLSSDDLKRREAALVPLQRLMDQPIDFDPSAPAEERAEQLRRLRERFAPPKKAEELGEDPAEE